LVQIFSLKCITLVSRRIRNQPLRQNNPPEMGPNAPSLPPSPTPPLSLNTLLSSQICYHFRAAKHNMISARFQIFTAVKIEVSWTLTPCSVLVGYQHFGRSCCLHLQGEVDLAFCHITLWCHNPEDHELNSQCDVHIMYHDVIQLVSVGVTLMTIFESDKG
jgi:hypothetical protein